MKPKHQKNCFSQALSALSTHQPSCLESIDSVCESIFNQNKNKLSRRRSETSLVDSLIIKDAKAKANLAEQRMIAKARELEVLREAPSLYKGSKKILRQRSQEEITAFVNSVSGCAHRKREKKEKVDLRRPQDVIEKPTPDEIREIIERMPVREKEEKVNLLSMSILEKTQFFLKKMSEKVENREKEKIDKEMEDCTFKPNLEKPKVPEPRHRKSNTATEGIHFKASKNRSSKNLKSKQNDLRIPAPTKKYKKTDAEVASPDPKPIISESYSQFSPVRVKYSYKPEENVKVLKKRSRQMVKYIPSSNI